MGTNYDRKRILTLEEKFQLIKAIQEDRIESFSYYKTNEKGFIDYVDSESFDIPLSVHICKISCGWKVLFDHNDWKYFKDRESLELFLKNGGWLENEYGEKVNLDKFWSDVESRQDLKSHAPDLMSRGSYIERDNLEFDTEFC